MNALADVGISMKRAGIRLWGVCAFASVEERLIACSAARRLPSMAKSVIAALFPYNAGEEERANLSRYARAKDYHAVAGGMLKRAAEELRGFFPDHSFEPFCDASPIPEVEAARLAGLGCRGKNGQLIHPEFGSWVFIGEIVTDLVLPLSAPGGECAGCGACARACPSGALGGGRVDAGLCLSAVTQKKGALSAEEEERIRRSGVIWGCDICQTVCPMNRSAALSDLPALREDRIARLEREDAELACFEEKYRDRAFVWRGAGVLRRNLRIIGAASEDTNDKLPKE